MRHPHLRSSHQMWRRILGKPLFLLPKPSFSSSSSSSAPQFPSLYSFLQPSIFTLNSPPPQPPPKPQPSPQQPQPHSESSLLSAIHSHNADAAWIAFKSLPPSSLSPSSASSLLSLLSSLPSRLNLKRSLVAALHLLSHSPSSLSPDSLLSLFHSLLSADAVAPALSLANSLLRSPLPFPFRSWAPPLIQLLRRHNSLDSFLPLFDQACRIAIQENIHVMRPGIDDCNDVLEGCSCVQDAEQVFGTISKLGLSPDLRSFSALAFLYASKGIKSRIDELDRLVCGLGFQDKILFYKSLINGYLKAGKFGSVSEVVLRVVKERGDGCSYALDGETYVKIVTGFIDSGKIKDLAALIVEAQELESGHQGLTVDHSVGFGIVNACVGLGLLDKAHSIVDEMNARGASVGIGVYSSILKAYCKERMTAEAAQLVSEISGSGLQLDADSYDALIDASMSAQDFQSAFSLFRDMREARLPDLKTSYLTIMTGLTENHRPELMASFLDTVIDDPRIEIATHDWNSIIHAFCKVGRMEDARRTYRRMVFLRFEPNNQTYLSLINGYVSAEKYFNVLLLWTEIRRIEMIQFDHDLIDAFLYALVKGGFFDAVMQVAGKAQELKIFVDKWRHKQAFMENHKKLRIAKLRRRNFRKMEALIAFKNWAGLTA